MGKKAFYVDESKRTILGPGVRLEGYYKYETWLKKKEKERIEQIRKEKAKERRIADEKRRKKFRRKLNWMLRYKITYGEKDRWGYVNIENLWKWDIPMDSFLLDELATAEDDEPFVFVEDIRMECDEEVLLTKGSKL